MSKYIEKQKEKIGLWIIFIMFSVFILLTIVLGIKQSLLLTGIKIKIESVFFVISFSAILWGFCLLLKKLNILPTNNYFNVAIVLSWVVLFIGFSLYSNMYKVELPLSIPTSLSNEGDLIKLTDNKTNHYIFFNLICVSILNRNYLSEWDVLNCNITTNLTKSEYNFSRVYATKTLTNMSGQKLDYICSGKGSCKVWLYTMDNSFSFFIAPEYSNGVDKIQPIYYYFELRKLRDWKDLENLEQNKFTLLIAIITASFLSVWAGVYYTKKILE